MRVIIASSQYWTIKCSDKTSRISCYPPVSFASQEMILGIDLSCWMGLALLKCERKCSTTQNTSWGPGAVFHLVILANWIKMLLEPHASSFMKCIHKNVNNLYLCQVQKSYWITWRKRLWSLSLCFSPFSTLGFWKRILKMGQMVVTSQALNSIQWKLIASWCFPKNPL